MTCRSEDLRVEVVTDRPTSGMWHCGPNPVWVTVTHVPTMVSAREMALACVERRIEDAGD